MLCLLAAFGLPATVPLAALVMVVGGASTIVPLTPGGAGTQQFLAVALSQTASATAVVSFSLAMQASVTLVNALLGLAAAMAMCRTLRPVTAVRSALAGGPRVSDPYSAPGSLRVRPDAPAARRWQRRGHRRR